jgi:hypothetical protein
MELAVALSKYVSEDDPLPLIEEFVAGYVAGGGELTEGEIALLPDCINLRMFSNVRARRAVHARPAPLTDRPGRDRALPPGVDTPAAGPGLAARRVFRVPRVTPHSARSPVAPATPNPPTPPPPTPTPQTIYFTGRAYVGEDGLESLTSRADAYARRVRWVEANRGTIVARITELMRAPVTAGAR